MTTKQLIYNEIELIDDLYLNDLYRIITQFVQSKQLSKQSSVMTRLRQIQIDAPKDFATNLDLYLSGEKDASTNFS